MPTWTSLLMSTLVCAAALLAGSAQAAQAYYLDPGSGSYLFQMAIAGVLGGLFALRQAWRKWRMRGSKSRKP
ncbi:MAG TPA: hypothetical protein PLZ36_06100 [Armatimonadota bacterium]|nr:hypothetical protein [Armatimonadota bacterium]HOS42517.1 hypothetical protein [Armatimonadota bacterium]